MVPEASTGRRSLRRLCAPRLRIQPCLSSIQLDWRRNFRLGTCARSTADHTRGYSQPTGISAELRCISPENPRHYNQPPAWSEAKAKQAADPVKQGWKL